MPALHDGDDMYLIDVFLQEPDASRGFILVNINFAEVAVVLPVLLVLDDLGHSLIELLLVRYGNVVVQEILNGHILI